MSDLQVKVDKRFASMFSDSRFDESGHAQVDMRGRKVKKVGKGGKKGAEAGEDTGKGGSFLQRFYHIDDESGAGKDGDKEEEELDDAPEEEGAVEDEEEIEVEEDEEAYASDSSTSLGSWEDGDSDGLPSSDEEDDEEEVAAKQEFPWGEQATSVTLGDGNTNRLACVGLNWDSIKAVDIFVVLRSFVPPNGVLHRVTIYPTEEGLAQLEKEEKEGPQGIYADEDEDSKRNRRKKGKKAKSEEEQAGIDNEKLRRLAQCLQICLLS